MSHSLADQLGWCITTQDYLNDLNKELSYVAQQYENSIDELKACGYMKEMLPSLELLCNEFVNNIENVMSYVEDAHIGYIHDRSQTIQSKLTSF